MPREASASLTPAKLIDIHKFMLAEYERLAFRLRKSTVLDVFGSKIEGFLAFFMPRRAKRRAPRTRAS